jgi:RND family efflux transporter MFP subunit
MKRIITIIVIVAILALIVFRLKSNHNKIEESKVVKTELGYVTVNVAPVKKITLDENLSLVGYLDAFSEVDVAAEAAGTITTLNAELGQMKPKGSVIATVDDKLKQLAVRKAQINLSKMEKNLERSKNLFDGGTLSEQQRDDAQTLYDDARVQLDQAQKQLDDATIKAPISGIVSKKQFERGEFINMGSPIVTLVDISRLKIKLNVSETNVYQLKVGDKTTITTDVYPGATFEGNISYISPKGDDTHNYPVEIQIANSSEYPLKSGTFANVTIQLPSSGEALYIPREALLGSVKEASVYVAENGKANLRNIVVGNGNNKLLKVVSGLTENDKVVVNGLINLIDGKEIKIIE